MHYLEARQMMIDGQIRPSDITDTRVIAAMAAIERERFVPRDWQELAYSDSAIPLSATRRMLPPTAFAKLLQAAGIAAEDVVLDVGCGGGYSTAVIARLCAFVVGIEDNDEQAAIAAGNLSTASITEAVVVTAPFTEGYAASAPYDVIVVEGAIEREPAGLLEQLKPGGRLVTILNTPNGGKGAVYLKTGEATNARILFDSAAPVLPGFEASSAFVF